MDATPLPEVGLDGFDALVAEERRPLVRMATLLVGSRAIAEEVVQDACWQVSRRWDDLDRPGAYLRTVVVRGCAAVLRRRALEERPDRRDPAPATTELPSHLVEVRDALERLGERQRIVVVLRYFVDLPDDEIAAVLDIRPATVRSIAKRALARLKEELR